MIKTEKDIPTKRKRLYLDIETSPNLGMFWTAGFKLNLSPENIIKERSTICICYKWEGEKSVSFLTWDSKQCDKKMLKEFVKVMNQADELVGHNGDKYDIAWIRTRCLYHSIPMFPTYRSIDTLKVARSKFKFQSNRLDYIGRFLGVGKKKDTGGFDLWKRIVLQKDKAAMKKMVEYCKGDVLLLQRVHERMGTHIEPKTHYGVTFGYERGSCPECGSDHIRAMVKRTTATGLQKQQYQCQTCFKYHTQTIKMPKK